MDKRKNFIKGPGDDFVCENCGQFVRGSAYLNHCPACLFSKHIDKDLPGDRNSSCGGLMEPKQAQFKNSHYIIIHKCLCCGKIIKNKTGRQDNLEQLILLSQISSPAEDDN